MPGPKLEKVRKQKVKHKPNNDFVEVHASTVSGHSKLQPVIPASPRLVNGLPLNMSGVRTHLTCELCGFEPVAKNRYQARQDHLMRFHFFDKMQMAFPDMSTRHCPFPSCNYIGRDKQYILRHYAIQHKMNDKWLTEALAERGIKYTPIRLRVRPGEPRKKPKHKLAFVINQPTMIQTYKCEKCGKKFDERCHLILHNRHVHLKYGDDERKRMDAHRCDICGKMFVDIKYVQTHKNSVHFKIKDFECEICHKKFAAIKSVKAHQKNVHKMNDLPADSKSSLQATVNQINSAA